MQAKSWCFTDNKCDENVWDAVECQYIVYGRESAPTTGQKHLQGYVSFDRPRRLAACKKIHPTAHWEVARGSADQNRTYCTKDGDFVERGAIPPGQGKRTDLVAIADAVKRRRTDVEIDEEFPGMLLRLGRQIDGYRARIFPPRDWPPEVFWYWGRPGTGKSRLVREEAGLDAYWHLGESSFWDGYSGQEKIVLDELRKETFTWSFLLRLLDRYPLRLNIKGSSCECQARKIWITSTFHPALLCPPGEDENQMLRRLTLVKEFSLPLQ